MRRYLEYTNQSGAPCQFSKTYRLVFNSTKHEQMLFNTVETWAKYSITDVDKVLDVQKDRQLKFRCHVDHLTAFNLLTWNDFKCFMNRGLKPTTLLSLFILYIKSKIVCDNLLWFDSNSLSLNG